MSTPWRRTTAVGCAVALALTVLAGCADGEPAAAPTPGGATTTAPGTSSPSTSAPSASAPSTSAPSTTAAPPTTTVDAGITTTTDAPAPTVTPRPKPSTGGPEPVTPADGSGCNPGAGPLPDGRWFGYVAEATGTELSFDLACWFTGRAAAREAARDGQESPPPNDYYVRNASAVLRPVAFAGDTQVTWYRQTGDPTAEVTTTYDEWLAARDGSMVLGVWLEVRGGVAVTIVEQWVP